jgi:hypothetical protein
MRRGIAWAGRDWTESNMEDWSGGTGMDGRLVARH